MNKVFVCNIIMIILTIIISTFMFTGCVSGVVSQEQYSEIFDGVSATDYDNNTVFYQMKTLVDNEKFNNELQSRTYCKLDIYLKKSCQIKGVVFLLRSSQDCSLKFTTYIDGEKYAENERSFFADKDQDIDLFFEEGIKANQLSDFYIEIEELNKTEDEEKTAFKFDSLIIFLEEE